MSQAKTDQSAKNIASATSPFEQIRMLEQREKERVEMEISATHKEKKEVEDALAKKEKQATEVLKAKAKVELKAYSEKELTSIVASAQKEAEKECSALESTYKTKRPPAVTFLLEKAKNPDFLLHTE